jgi:non-specific protein-tyrosine kinase
MDEPIHCLQVTSASAAEGKTTTIANLAVVLARAGERQVVVVDCDLRRPRLHEFFDLPNVVGFTSVMLGEVPLSRALQSIDAEKGISVLTSGPVPSHPSELLASRRSGEVLAALRSEGALVLIDTPPVLPVTDALVVSRWADAILLVSAAGITTKKQVHRALELLNQVEAPLVGSVMNQAPTDGSGYGYAGRYYGAEKVHDDGANGSKPKRLSPKASVRS